MAINLNATATINMNAPHLAQFTSAFNQMNQQMQQMPGMWQRINVASITALHNMRMATAAMQANTTAATSQLGSFSSMLARTTHNMNRNLIQPMMHFLGTAGRGLAAVGGMAGRGLGYGAVGVGHGVYGAGSWLFGGGGGGAGGGGGGGGGGGPGPNMTFGRGQFFTRSGMISGFRGMGAGTLLSGLAGGGSLWGINSLASGASDARRYYTGIGSDYGFTKSFPLAFGGQMDARAFMSAIGGAQMNPGGGAYAGLASMGLDVGGMNTNDLSRAALLEMRKRTAGMNVQQLGNFFHGYGLDETMSPEHFRNMMTMKQPEFEEKFMKQIGTESALSIPDDILKTWQDLYQTIKRTGEVIQKELIVSLVGLAEPIGKLSTSIGNLFTSVMNTDFMKHFISNTKTEFSRVADFVNPDSYKDGKNPFVDWMHREIADLKTVVTESWKGTGGQGLWNKYMEPHWNQYGIPILNSAAQSATGYQQRTFPNAATDNRGFWERFKDATSAFVSPVSNWSGWQQPLFTIPNPFRGSSGGGTLPGPNDWNPATGNLNDQEKAILRSLYGNEANKDPKNGPTGYRSIGDKNSDPMQQSYGAFQIKGFNIADWSRRHLGREIGLTEFMESPMAQDRMAIGQYQEYLRQTGSHAEAAARWHGGPGAIAAKDMAYVNSFMATMRAQPGMSKLELVLHNTTGNNVTANTTANGMVTYQEGGPYPPY